MFRLRGLAMLLGMTTFAVCGAFFHLGVTILTSIFVCYILAESFNFSTFSFCMALGAVFNQLGMFLMLEGNPFFQLDHIRSEC